MGVAMKLEQLSIFLESRSGRLAEITGVLARAGIMGESRGIPRGE